MYCSVIMGVIFSFISMSDHVYFVHPSTGISVDILTNSRPMYRLTYQSSIGGYVDRHIGRESVFMSTEVCRSTYRQTYQSSIGRCVNRHSTDMLADTSTESDCPIVGRHVIDRLPTFRRYFTATCPGCVTWNKIQKSYI